MPCLVTYKGKNLLGYNLSQPYNVEYQNGQDLTHVEHYSTQLKPRKQFSNPAKSAANLYQRKKSPNHGHQSGIPVRARLWRIEARAAASWRTRDSCAAARRRAGVHGWTLLRCDYRPGRLDASMVLMDLMRARGEERGKGDLVLEKLELIDSC
jgi:hypothetical protein